MKIMIDEKMPRHVRDLEESVPVQSFLNKTNAGVKKWHYSSHENTLVPRTRSRYPDKTSLFVRAAHIAYDQHIPLAISPEVIWHVVLHEVGIAINANPEPHAHLFTNKPDEKQHVEIERNDFVYGGKNDWSGALVDFENELREKFVPAGTMDHFLPDLSTVRGNPISRAALSGAFMSAVQSYYEFTMHTLCGIPEVRLDGTPEDWRLLVQKAAQLSEVVQGLDTYFNALKPVLNKIALTAEGKEEDLEFWESLYKIDGGSGGDRVTGWVGDLFAYYNTYEGPRLKDAEANFGAWKRYGGWGTGTNKFPSQLSSVPFIWNYLDKEIPMQIVSGPLSIIFDDEGFLKTELGFAIAEREA